MRSRNSQSNPARPFRVGLCVAGLAWLMISQPVEAQSPPGPPGSRPVGRRISERRNEPTPRPTITTVQHTLPAAPGKMASDEKRAADEVGRKYLKPLPLPASPPGMEALIEEPIVASEVTGLSLGELLDLACSHNPTIEQAQAQIAGTLGKAIEAGLYPNPIVSYVGDQIGVRRGSIRNTAGEFQGGVVQQEFVTAHKRKLSREKYLQRAKAAEFVALAQEWRVCNDVRIHFWQALGRRQIVEIRKELAKSAEDFAVTARERWNLGQATRAELHMSNVTLQRARLDLLQAENKYRRSFGELTSLVGLELPVQPLLGDLEVETEPLDFEQQMAQLASDSPQIHAARAKYQADRITVQRETVEPIPNIVVRAGTGYDFESQENVATAQVSIEVPVFDRNQGTIRQAEADLMRQNLEIRRVELSLRRELAQRFEEYTTALQQVTEFRDVILPEARAAYQEQLEAYKQNRQNWGDVLHAQRDYFDLRQIYIEQLMALRTSEVLLQGNLLQGGLDAAPNPIPAGHIDAVPQPR